MVQNQDLALEICQKLYIIIYFSCYSYTFAIFEIRLGYSPRIYWFGKLIGDKWKKHIENNCTYY